MGVRYFFEMLALHKKYRINIGTFTNHVITYKCHFYSKFEPLVLKNGGLNFFPLF